MRIVEITELYYTNGFDVYGPVSMEDFCKNKYYKSTKIWYEGLDGWILLGDSDVLKHCVGTMAADSVVVDTQIARSGGFPPLNQMQPKDNIPKTELVVEEEKDTKLNKYIIALLIFAVITSSFLLFKNINKKDQESIETENNPVAMNDSLAQTDSAIDPEVKEEIVKDATQLGVQKTHRLNWDKFILVQPDYRKKELGGIDNVKIALENKSPYKLDYVKVKVDYLKANGEIYLSEHLEFHDVKSETIKDLFAPDSKRGVEIQCSIEEAKSYAMNFCFKKETKADASEDPYRCKK